MIKQASCCTPSPCYLFSQECHCSITRWSRDHLMWVMWHPCDHVTVSARCVVKVSTPKLQILSTALISDLCTWLYYCDHVVWLPNLFSLLLFLSLVPKPEAETQWIQWLLQPLEENNVSSWWTRLAHTITSQSSWGTFYLVHGIIAIHLILEYKYIIYSTLPLFLW